MGVLYVVPTPIGNLGDMTKRAEETLANADFIACEDTRVGGKLLNLLGIKKPLVSYHEHNSQKAGEAVLARIEGGENCALITDAGTPAVSDPGSLLVDMCAKRGITVVALPGCCAAVTALSGSGIAAKRFVFEGFLPDDAAGRQERLEFLKNEERAVIFYIAPHDLERNVAEISQALGERDCCLAKELTKLHERYIRCSLSELPSFLQSLSQPEKKGEFVLITGEKQKSEEFWIELDIKQHCDFYLSLGMSSMDACKQVAKDRGIPKSAVYAELHRS